MGRVDFIAGLRALDYTVLREDPQGPVISYPIEHGRHAGTTVELGFEVGDDWPANPPSGPHVKPHLLTLNASSEPHPVGGVHAARAFGSDFQYWSRPFRPDLGWQNTDRSVTTYMRFIASLFATL